jgi:SNF2 family DNA or RNA helicase
LAKAWKRNPHGHWVRDHLGLVVKNISYEKAGIVLPAQHCIEELVDLTDKERTAYEALEQNLADTYRSFVHKQLAEWADVLAALGRMRLTSVAPCLLNVKHVKATNLIDLTEEKEQDEQDAEQEMEVDPSDLDHFVSTVLGEGGIYASKIQRALALVDTFVHQPREQDQPPRKMLIFSMFSSVLHLLQLAFAKSEQHRNVRLLRIDGTVKGALARKAILADFRAYQDGPCVLLLSGKVGGEGLTLIEATGGILMEPHWNRSDARQQQRRFWRLGQTQETTWWTLRAKDTIETFVLDLCNHKDKLETLIQTGKGAKNPGSSGSGLDKQTLREFMEQRAKRIRERQVQPTPPQPQPQPLLIDLSL